jgi:DNA ligase-1
LGLGPSLISRSIQNVSGVTASALKRLYNTLGDPGDVAFSAKSNLRTLIPHPPLTITFVYESLLRIAHAKGQGSAKRKENIVQKLLLSANGEEIRFLTRTLCQNLRVGAVRTSILTALARAVVLSRLSDDAVEDDFRISSDLLTKVKTSLTSNKKKDVDPARLRLSEAFAKAEALVKNVFVKHPNFSDITYALLKTGLANLDTNVPLTIG